VTSDRPVTSRSAEPGGPTDPNPRLSAALAELIVTAQAAGVDESVARAEGEALAATIAEPARGAFGDWSAQTGRDRSAEEFFDAASRGRRWRSAPTATLSTLVVNSSPTAGDYATALAGVCSAACGLGEPTMRVVGNATMAAAAQLQATGQSTAPPTDERQHTGPTTAASRAQIGSGEPPSGPAAQHLLTRLLSTVTEAQAKVSDQLRTLRSSSEDTTLRPGSSLDLGSLDPFAAGAFTGIGAGTSPTLPAARPTEQPVVPTNPAAPAAGTVAGEQPAPTQPAPVEREPVPKSLDELLAELDDLVGLDAVKGEIHRQVAVLRVEGLRTKAGLTSPTLTRHLVFTGNPGTGKTTVARLVSGIYRALGLLTKGQLVEVDRSELVAGYLGQTAIKTAEVVASAEGGVLFIDEAYSLSGDQYGSEAVDTLVKEMEDKRNDLVVIVAGYPAPMAEFITNNPGLASRFRTTIDFVDYSDDELVEILTSMAAAADYDLSGDCLTTFRDLLGDQQRGSTFGNGRFSRNCLEAAIGRHAWRLRDVADPTLEQLRELRPQDLQPGDGEEPEPARVTAQTDDARWGAWTGWGSVDEVAYAPDPPSVGSVRPQVPSTGGAS